MHYQPIREKPLVGISLVGSNKRITRPNSSGTINAFPTDQDVMTLQEAAEFLKCNPATIKRRADALHIPYKRLGSLWRFSRKALEAWMADADNAMAA
jgi:excisionase family DNA binding protein